MKISYNEACSRDCSTLEQDLILCEKAGFDYIEIRFDKLAQYLQDHTLADLKTFFAGSHLKPHALNAVYLYDDFLTGRDDPAKAQRLIEQFTYGLLAARQIGSPALIIVPPFEPEGKPYPPDPSVPERCVRMLLQLGRMAGEYGIRLCFEIVGLKKSSVRTLSLAKKIVEAVNLPNVGYAVDSYNLHLFDKLNDFSEISSLGKEKLFAVHLTNGDPVPEEEMGQDKRRFPDAGEVDLDGFLGVIREMGYEDMVSVEVFRPEYWQKSPEWVISEAYRTTAAVMHKAGCF